MNRSKAPGARQRQQRYLDPDWALRDGAAVPAVTVSVTSTNSVTKDGAYVPHPSSSPTANVTSGTPVATAPAGSEFQGQHLYQWLSESSAITDLTRWRICRYLDTRIKQDGSSGYPGVLVSGIMHQATSVGAEFQVNTYTQHQQGLPRYHGDCDGGFAVAWQLTGIKTGPIGDLWPKF